jgi:hypothetical protein
MFEQLKCLNIKYHENFSRGFRAVRVHVLMD